MSRPSRSANGLTERNNNSFVNSTASSTHQTRAAEAALVYAALGASDVMGEGADHPETEAWPVVLQGRLSTHVLMHRLGVSGSTALEALEEQVPAAEAARPGLVTVWLAVNDYRHQVPVRSYRNALDEIVHRMAGTGAGVFVGNLPDLKGIPELSEGKDPEWLADQLAEWNATIAGVVAANGAHLVDLQAASEGLEEDMSVLVSEDRFHPSTLGHVALAEIFLHHIEPHL